MGAWGTGVFEDDFACDFICEIADSGSSAKKVIKRVLKAGKRSHNRFIDSDLCSELLATAALASGTLPDGEEEPEEFRAASEIVRGVLKPKDLVALRGFVQGVIESERSELRQLWEETDEFSTWQTGARQVLQSIPG